LFTRWVDKNVKSVRLPHDIDPIIFMQVIYTLKFKNFTPTSIGKEYCDYFGVDYGKSKKIDKLNYIADVLRVESVSSEATNFKRHDVLKIGKVCFLLGGPQGFMYTSNGGFRSDPGYGTADNASRTAARAHFERFMLNENFQVLVVEKDAKDSIIAEKKIRIKNMKLKSAVGGIGSRPYITTLEIPLENFLKLGESGRPVNNFSVKVICADPQCTAALEISAIVRFDPNAKPQETADESHA
jgi:hypothetical protein